MRALFAVAAEIAGRQHGRVTRRQLLAAGIDANRIKRWLADGRLRHVHYGVYAVGHVAPSMHGDYRGAVLAGGGGAKLSHAPAAHVFKVTRGKRPPPPEITVPTTAHRRRPGIVIHRVKALHPYDVTVHEGIPITSVPRVLLDMAPRLSPAKLGRACHEAWVHHHTTPAHVEACIARNPNKPGIAKLRHALGSDVTLSDLEDAFLALLDSHGLPLPRTNIDVRGRQGRLPLARSTASPSSCSPSASTPPATASRRTSRAGGARSTSPTRTATSSSAATPPPPSCVSGSRSRALAPRA